MHLKKNIQTYVFENMKDGVLLLDFKGNISYANDACRKILKIENDEDFLKEGILKGHDYDALNNFVIETILDKSQNHENVIEYQDKILNLKSSYWKKEEEEGILLILQDLTKTEKAIKERKQAIFVLSSIIYAVCFWAIIVKLKTTFNWPLQDFQMTYLLYAVVVPIIVLMARKMNMSWKDLGFSFERLNTNLKESLMVILVFAILLISMKYIFVNLGIFFPADLPFWDFNFTFGMKIYPISVFFQELLSQGIIHGVLNKIFSGKNKALYVNILTAVMFAALHIHRDVMFMVGAFVLVCAIGFLFDRQKSIWGLVIVHYSVSMLSFFLNWL